MLRYSTKKVFIIGFFIGFSIALFFKKDKSRQSKSYAVNDPYEKWFISKNVYRLHRDIDELRYGSKENLTEAEFLYNNINVICAVLVHNIKNINAITNTWGMKCNELIFYSLPNIKNEEKKTTKLINYNANSSWHLLCQLLRSLNHNVFNWIIFVNDDMFVIVDNLRKLVAPLNYNNSYYLGHAMMFWGTVYNAAEAGYVLSYGAIKNLLKKFYSNERCKGVRFWKKEDYYLAKHLASMNISASDTRDIYTLSTFHGYNLNQLLFPGSLTELANYYKYAVYPFKCCSDHSITFQSIEADKMYTYNYFLYHLQIFSYGNKGNIPAPTPMPEKEVWRSFLRQRGIYGNVSSEQYFDLWKTIVSDPESFNQMLRTQYYGNV